VIAVNDLLKLAIEGHGGLPRWQQITRFGGAASITGAIWTLKGQPGLLDGVVLEGETRDQRLRITPFPRPGRYATWESYRQTIETADGVPIGERPDPAASFAGLTRQSPWDELQVAYFAGEATWNYFVAPFLFACSDFVTQETGPWHENGQTWRRLLVAYLGTIVAHTRQQTYYFDDAGLLRRLDYSVDILGGGPAVHYPSEYREFNEIMVPTRRRVYVRNPDESPVLDSTSIAVDVTDVTFSEEEPMRADIPGWIFPDYELTDHTKIQRRLSELQGIDPMIPYTLVLKPELVIYSVYNNPGGA
jgi:hypothetical protein